MASEMVLRLSDIKRAFHFKVAESDPGSGLGQSGFNEKMVGSAVTEAGKDRDTGDGLVFLCMGGFDGGPGGHVPPKIVGPEILSGPESRRK